MDLWKTILLAVTSLLFLSTVSTANIQMEGLTAEEVNQSFDDRKVTFITSYLNKSLTYGQLLIPDELRDDLVELRDNGAPRVVQDGVGIFQPPGQQSRELSLAYKFRDDASVPELQNWQYGDFAGNRNSGLKPKNGEATVLLDSQGRDRVFSTELKDGGVRWNITVTSHYEHLVVDYEVVDSSGEVVWTDQDVYSGKDTDKIPITSGTAGKYEEVGSKDFDYRLKAEYDNLYEKEEEISVLISYPSKYSFESLKASGSENVEKVQSDGLYQKAESRIDKENISDYFKIKENNYNFTAYNVTVRKNFSTSIKSYVNLDSELSGNGRFRMYILGSIGAIGGSTSTSTTNNIEVVYKSSNEWVMTYDQSGDLTNLSVKAQQVGGIGDYDQDGNIGVAYRSTSNDINIVEKTGDILDTGLDSTADYNVAMMLFDYDDDGFPEIFKGSSSPYFEWTDVNGEGGTASFSGSVSSVGDIADFDSDGGYEIMYEDFGNIKYVDISDGTTSDTGLDSTNRMGRGGTVDIDDNGDPEQFLDSSDLGQFGFVGASGDSYGFDTSGSVRDVGGLAYWDGDDSDVEGFYINSDGDLKIASFSDSYSATYSDTGIQASDDVSAVGTFNPNSQPNFDNQNLIWENIGNGETININYSISDPDGDDISSHNAIPDGTEEKFTNSTLKVSGISSPFNYFAEITDFAGATASIETNYTFSNTGYQEDDHSHGLGTQRINLSSDIENRGASSGYEVSHADPSGYSSVVQGTSWSGTLSSSETITKTSVWSGDWITGETESTYTRYADLDYSHDEDMQRIHNRTKLVVDNSRSFTFSSVDISSTCSRTTTADVPSGNSAQVTDDCNRPMFTGDWISETASQEYVDTGYSHDLDTQKIAKNKTLTEDGGYSWSQVDISPPSISGSCTDCSTRSRDLSASASVKETYHATGDWITSEALGTYNRYSDGDFNHGEDTQRIHNRTELVVDNDKNLKFPDVDLTSTCSRDSSADVPAGTGIRISNDCTRPVFKIDAVNESTSTLYEDTGYNHSLSSQGVAKNKTLNETEGYRFTEVNVSAPSVPGSAVNGGIREVDLSSGGSATEIYNSTGDWIQDEREVQEAFGQDLSQVNDIDQQYLYNQTRLVVNNTRSFGYSSVDLSNTCSDTTEADVPSGKSTVTESCDNRSISGDWIKNEDNQSTEYVSGDVLFGKDLSTEYKATQGVEVTNVRTDEDLEIDLGKLVSDVPGCSLANSSTQNVPADTVSQFEFRKSCSPGQHLNRTPVVKTETDSFYRYDIEFGFEVHSNLTEEQGTEYAVKSSWADNWNSRDPTETEALVDNSSKDIQVDERVIGGTEYIIFQIRDEHTNSSIHEGTHSASLTYYEDKTPGSTSGGSSSGGGGFTGGGSETTVDENNGSRFAWSVSAITSDDTQQFGIQGYSGDTFEKYIVVTNTGGRNVTLDLDCVSQTGACSYVDTSVDRVVLNRNSFSEKEVKVSGQLPGNFSQRTRPATFSIRVTDPEWNGSSSTGDSVSYVDFTVSNSPVFGKALDLAYKVVEIRSFESPFDWGNDVPYPFLLIPLLLSMLTWGAVSAGEWLFAKRQYSNLKIGVTLLVFLIAFVLL